jgi:DNA-binding FadR family transcriptional regulator
VQFANILFSSLVSNLKKAIYGRDDDTKTNTQEQTEREELANLNMMSAIADEDNEANGKSIKSHMDNIARQYNNWANSFKD